MTVLRPEIVPVIARIYRLRWNLQYVDKPARVGKWNNLGGVEGELAMVPKKGLARALVEAENCATFEMITLVDVPGQDYAHAEWGMHVRSPSVGFDGSIALNRPAVNSLSFWTNDEKITAYIDGSIARRSLTEDEQRFDFREHRAGT